MASLFLIGFLYQPLAWKKCSLSVVVVYDFVFPESLEGCDVSIMSLAIDEPRHFESGDLAVISHYFEREDSVSERASETDREKERERER